MIYLLHPRKTEKDRKREKVVPKWLAGVLFGTVKAQLTNFGYGFRD